MENVVLNGNSTLQTASTIENEQIKSFDSDKDETTVMEKSVQFVNYHIRAAMLLQRNPIIMKAQTPFEASYEEYRELYQFQTSRGVLQFQNSGNEDKRGEGNNEEGSNSSFNENNRKSSASMMVNKNDNEISNNPFGTNSEKTMEIQKLFNDHKEYYDNHDKNTKSLKRKLDRKLYLMIKDEINGEPGRWILPFHTLTNESIPIHMMARKAIEKIVNVKAMNFYWIGRAPIGYFMEKWTDRIKSPFGHKTFIFKGQILKGHFEFLNNANIDYAWLTKEEILNDYPIGDPEHIKHLLSE